VEGFSFITQLPADETHADSAEVFAI